MLASASDPTTTTTTKLPADADSSSWSVPCWPNDSDDPLEPPAEELENMFRLLEQGGVLELQWKCPGRRLPSPVSTASGGAASEASEATTPEKDTPTKNKDFDFMDEVATPTMRVRGQNATPKGSAKKKTANFAGVMDAMKKHGRITGPSAAAGAQPTTTTATTTSTTPANGSNATTASTAPAAAGTSSGGAAAKPAEQG